LKLNVGENKTFDRLLRYCKKNNLIIRTHIVKKGSIVYYLYDEKENNSLLFVGKQLTSQKKNMHTRISKVSNILSKLNNQNSEFVSTPKITFSSKKYQFYITEYFDGKSLNEIKLDNPINQALLINLFNWLKSFYIKNKTFRSKSRKYPFSALMPFTYSKKLNINLEKHLIHGDLTPWNILVDRKGKICIIDWDNSGAGYPAFDLARFILQLYSKQILRIKLKNDILKIFWSYMASFYNYNHKNFIHAINFQEEYSKKIFNDNIRNEGNILYILKHLAIFIRLKLAAYQLKSKIKKLND